VVRELGDVILITFDYILLIEYFVKVFDEISNIRTMSTMVAFGEKVSLLSVDVCAGLWLLGTPVGTVRARILPYILSLLFEVLDTATYECGIFYVNVQHSINKGELDRLVYLTLDRMFKFQPSAEQPFTSTLQGRIIAVWGLKDGLNTVTENTMSLSDDLKFDIYKLTKKPVTPEDYKALLREAILIVENLNEDLDDILNRPS
jgi:hypothetical protein